MGLSLSMREPCSQPATRINHERYVHRRLYYQSPTETNYYSSRSGHLTQQRNTLGRHSTSLRLLHYHGEYTSRKAMRQESLCHQVIATLRLDGKSVVSRFVEAKLKCTRSMPTISHNAT